MAGKKDKKKRKDSQLIIRVDAEEREAFVSLCDSMDTSASREVRRFMKRFIAENGGAQGPEKGSEKDAAASPKQD